jgi:hypothetical protein
MSDRLPRFVDKSDGIIHNISRDFSPTPILSEKKVQIYWHEICQCLSHPQNELIVDDLKVPYNNFILLQLNA